MESKNRKSNDRKKDNALISALANIEIEELAVVENGMNNVTYNV